MISESGETIFFEGKMKNMPNEEAIKQFISENSTSDVTIKSTATEKSLDPNCDMVNQMGISSSTDYLVWVSLSEYKVRIYKGSKDDWDYMNAYDCAIGAPETPTTEGTFRYIERIESWNYDTFYCGPVMRYHDGYAMHSTLIGYDGIPIDNSVGAQITLGCIRLRPESINQIVSIIPMYTTIHITK